jgi:pyridoxine 4-dehydrogenase
MGLSFGYGPETNKEEAIKLIRRAFELGINFFDTAEAYGPYANEELVGEALASLSKNIIITSKFGFNIHNGKPEGLNSRPEQIRKVAELSLKRLKLETIDWF